MNLPKNSLSAWDISVILIYAENSAPQAGFFQTVRCSLISGLFFQIPTHVAAFIYWKAYLKHQSSRHICCFHSVPASLCYWVCIKKKDVWSKKQWTIDDYMCLICLSQQPTLGFEFSKALYQGSECILGPSFISIALGLLSPKEMGRQHWTENCHPQQCLCHGALQPRSFTSHKY